MSKLPLGTTGGVLGFTELKERLDSCGLYDMTALKLRLALRGVKRLIKHEPDGKPIYAINPINVVRAVNVLEELRAKSKKSELPPVQL